MTRIDRKAFKSDFMRDGNEVAIDVKHLDSSTVEKLSKAGVTVKDLLEITGKGGKIDTDAEYDKLFDTIDSFEKNDGSAGSHDYFDTTDANNLPTLSGEVHDALKLEVNRKLDKARAEGILTSSPKVAKTDSYAKHVAQVHADLKKEKLPASAKGVTVILISDEPDHTAAVTRTVAGKVVGLAKDADVRPQEFGNHQATYVNNHPYTKELQASKGELSVQDIAKLGVVQAEAMLYAAGEEINTARKNLPADGKTRIANMSFGRSMAGIAADAAVKVPEGSKMWNDAVAAVEARSNGTKFDRTNPKHFAFVQRELAVEIAAEMKTLQSEPANKVTFTALERRLQLEVDAARKKGILIFNAAGNDGLKAQAMGDPKLGTIFSDNIKGMVTVGAADLSKDGKAGASAMWNKSAEGASVEIAAPGVNVPVGSVAGKAAPETGTSFASPYAASVAALMVAANPKITPDEIESILTSGRVTVDLPGTTDGIGLLDPVKAVREAKALAVK